MSTFTRYNSFSCIFNNFWVKSILLNLKIPWFWIWQLKTNAVHGDQSHGYFPSITYVHLDLNVQSVCWEIIHLLLICDFCYIQNVIIPKGDNIWISENDIICDVNNIICDVNNIIGWSPCSILIVLIMLPICIRFLSK